MSTTSTRPPDLTEIPDSVVELLDDLGLVIPCETGWHAESKHGCEAAAPGRWRVMIQHAANASTCDPPTVIIICDPGVRRIQHDAGTIMRMLHTAGAALVCRRCGAPIDPATAFVVVGEVV